MRAAAARATAPASTRNRGRAGVTHPRPRGRVGTPQADPAPLDVRRARLSPCRTTGDSRHGQSRRCLRSVSAPVGASPAVREKPSPLGHPAGATLRIARPARRVEDAGGRAKEGDPGSPFCTYVPRGHADRSIDAEGEGAALHGPSGGEAAGAETGCFQRLRTRARRTGWGHAADLGGRRSRVAPHCRRVWRRQDRA